MSGGAVDAAISAATWALRVVLALSSAGAAVQMAKFLSHQVVRGAL